MTGSQNRSRNVIRRAIYTLKYEFGYSVDFYKIEKGTYNTQTGIYDVTLNKLNVKRAIIFPTNIHRNFFFSISVIQANSQFIQGGDIKLNDRQIIIDGRDLPHNYVININDYFIWENQRYDIVNAEQLEYKTGWTILGRKIDGAKNGQIHERNLSDIVNTFQSFQY